MTAPDQTNAEVSDERLRDDLTLADRLTLAFQRCKTFTEAGGGSMDAFEIVLMAQYRLAEAAAALNRRSQASEGAVAWLCTHKDTGAQTLEFRAKADLPYNRKHWNLIPLVCADAGSAEKVDSGTIRGDETTAAAMERAQRLRERGWKLEAAAERLEQEAHDRAIKRGEHTGTDGI